MQKYSDPLDAAADRVEEFTQQSIDNVLRNGGQPVLAFTGQCHTCRAAVVSPHRFCDEECANEYEYIQKRLKANRPVV